MIRRVNAIGSCRYPRPTVSIAWQCVFHKRGDFIGSTHRTLCFHQHASWLIILDQTSCRSRTSTSRQLQCDECMHACMDEGGCVNPLENKRYTLTTGVPLRRLIRQQRQASKSRVSPPLPTRNGVRWSIEACTRTDKVAKAWLLGEG